MPIKRGWRCQNCGIVQGLRVHTFARAAGWEPMLKGISLRYARAVTEPDTFIATSREKPTPVIYSFTFYKKLERLGEI